MYAKQYLLHTGCDEIGYMPCEQSNVWSMENNNLAKDDKQYIKTGNCIFCDTKGVNFTNMALIHTSAVSKL